MAERSRFYEITLRVELQPDHWLYGKENTYMVGRMIEKAVDGNTDMIAYIHDVRVVDGR